MSLDHPAPPDHFTDLHQSSEGVCELTPPQAAVTRPSNRTVQVSNQDPRHPSVACDLTSPLQPDACAADRGAILGGPNAGGLPQGQERVETDGGTTEVSPVGDGTRVSVGAEMSPQGCQFQPANLSEESARQAAPEPMRPHQQQSPTTRTTTERQTRDHRAPLSSHPETSLRRHLLRERLEREGAGRVRHDPVDAFLDPADEADNGSGQFPPSSSSRPESGLLGASSPMSFDYPDAVRMLVTLREASVVAPWLLEQSLSSALRHPHLETTARADPDPAAPAPGSPPALFMSWARSLLDGSDSRPSRPGRTASEEPDEQSTSIRGDEETGARQTLASSESRGGRQGVDDLVFVPATTVLRRRYGSRDQNTVVPEEALEEVSILGDGDGRRVTRVFRRNPGLFDAFLGPNSNSLPLPTPSLTNNFAHPSLVSAFASSDSISTLVLPVETFRPAGAALDDGNLGAENAELRYQMIQEATRLLSAIDQDASGVRWPAIRRYLRRYERTAARAGGRNANEGDQGVLGEEERARLRRQAMVDLVDGSLVRLVRLNVPLDGLFDLGAGFGEHRRSAASTPARPAPDRADSGFLDGDSDVDTGRWAEPIFVVSGLDGDSSASVDSNQQQSSPTVRDRVRQETSRSITSGNGPTIRDDATPSQTHNPSEAASDSPPSDRTTDPLQPSEDTRSSTPTPTSVFASRTTTAPPTDTASGPNPTWTDAPSAPHGTFADVQAELNSLLVSSLPTPDRASTFVPGSRPSHHREPRISFSINLGSGGGSAGGGDPPGTFRSRLPRYIGGRSGSSTARSDSRRPLGLFPGRFLPPPNGVGSADLFEFGTDGPAAGVLAADTRGGVPETSRQTFQRLMHAIRASLRSLNDELNAITDGLRDDAPAPPSPTPSASTSTTPTASGGGAQYYGSPAFSRRTLATARRIRSLMESLLEMPVATGPTREIPYDDLAERLSRVATGLSRLHRAVRGRNSVERPGVVVDDVPNRGRGGERVVIEDLELETGRTEDRSALPRRTPAATDGRNDRRRRLSDASGGEYPTRRQRRGGPSGSGGTAVEAWDSGLEPGLLDALGVASGQPSPRVDAATTPPTRPAVPISQPPPESPALEERMWRQELAARYLRRTATGGAATSEPLGGPDRLVFLGQLQEILGGAHAALRHQGGRGTGPNVVEALPRSAGSLNLTAGEFDGWRTSNASAEPPVDPAVHGTSSIPYRPPHQQPAPAAPVRRHPHPTDLDAHVSRHDGLARPSDDSTVCTLAKLLDGNGDPVDKTAGCDPDSIIRVLCYHYSRPFGDFSVGGGGVGTGVGAGSAGHYYFPPSLWPYPGMATWPQQQYQTGGTGSYGAWGRPPQPAVALGLAPPLVEVTSSGLRWLGRGRRSQSGIVNR
ncbi:hypothetical protein HDU96_002424 [Phlyctochytrium bullatum]|nr:hypothetical protein HDU96_002424 [Phlyctochytrium bullatum]